MYFIIYERSIIFMSRKIIFFDADGTIINKTFISSQTVASVNQLKMNGHIPVLATGRARKSIQQIVDILDLKYLICSSGNHIIIKLFFKTIYLIMNCRKLFVILTCLD